MPPGVGVLAFFGELFSLLVCFRHILAPSFGIGVRMLLVNLFISLVRLSHISGVPTVICVLIFFGDLFTLLVCSLNVLALSSRGKQPMFLPNLCTPLVRFWRILACLLALAY